jgi:hypothetical protein
MKHIKLMSPTACLGLQVISQLLCHKYSSEQRLFTYSNSVWHKSHCTLLETPLTKLVWREGNISSARCSKIFGTLVAREWRIFCNLGEVRLAFMMILLNVIAQLQTERMYDIADICLQSESKQTCHCIHKIYQGLRFLECTEWGKIY